MITVSKEMAKRDNGAGRPKSDATDAVRIKADLSHMIKVILTKREGGAAELLDPILRPVIISMYFEVMEELREEEARLKKANKSS
jgi:hypothetical protein